MEPSWSTFLFQQANEALHHQHHGVGNGLLPLLNSEPTDQKPVLPILMEQKPQNSSHSYISTVAGILTTATTSTGTGGVAAMQHQHQHSIAKKPPKPVKKNHGCDMCGKAFRDVYHLNRHKLSHSDEKPFECPICQQRFKRKDRMTCHVRSHNGAVHKPYICSVCGKGFSRPDHLSCHVKHVHSSERPFKCQVTACTSAFATKDRLRSHMIRHEGKVTCNICGKMLSAAYITSHLKTHGQAGFSSTACTNKEQCIPKPWEECKCLLAKVLDRPKGRETTVSAADLPRHAEKWKRTIKPPQFMFLQGDEIRRSLLSIELQEKACALYIVDIVLLWLYIVLVLSLVFFIHGILIINY